MKNIFHISIIAVIVILMASLSANAEGKNSGNPTIIANIEQHDTDIKVLIEEGNSDINGAIRRHHNAIQEDLGVHDEDMTTEHRRLARLLEGLCPDCPDAWDKLLTEDRFELVMNGEGVRDNETCLVWEQSPDNIPRTWGNAIAKCLGMSLGGRRGWRGPTAAELASLHDLTQPYPSLPSGHPFDPNAFSLVPDAFWTLTTSPANPRAMKYVVQFTQGMDGTLEADVLDDPHQVWCVRGGGASVDFVVPETP